MLVGHRNKSSHAVHTLIGSHSSLRPSAGLADGPLVMYVTSNMSAVHSLPTRAQLLELRRAGVTQWRCTKDGVTL